MRELESLQEAALSSLNQGAFSGLMELVQKQEEVQVRIAATRGQLSPVLQKFESLPEGDKAEMREKGVGEIIRQIEAVAHAIQGRHTGAFPEPAGPAQAGDSVSTQETKATVENQDADLQARLQRFRQL